MSGACQAWIPGFPCIPCCFVWHLARRLVLLGVLILQAGASFAQNPPQAEPRSRQPARELPVKQSLEDRILDQLVAHIAASARALQVVESSSERLSKPPAVAPGAPPLLSFRYFEGKQRHRFGNLDLVMDDAGH